MTVCHLGVCADTAWLVFSQGKFGQRLNDKSGLHKGSGAVAKHVRYAPFVDNVDSIQEVLLAVHKLESFSDDWCMPDTSCNDVLHTPMKTALTVSLGMTCRRIQHTHKLCLRYAAWMVTSGCGAQTQIAGACFVPDDGHRLSL